MNRDIFDILWNKGKPPGQQKEEWFHFLDFVNRRWENTSFKPVIVEIGIRRGGQKRFWQELGATHIGIDISNKYAEPDITGDSHDRNTWRRLDVRLRTLRKNGNCDLLFIDGDHLYEGVKKDYYEYSSLCSGIVALHDIECLKKDVEVKQFWAELKGENLNQTFIEFFHPHPPGHYGIGAIL